MNRQDFIQVAGAGLFLPGVLKEHRAGAAGPGIVKNKAKGEIWFVREQTPITIQLSKGGDGVLPISICSEQILPGNGIAIHKHLNEGEYFYFLSGEGRFQLGDDTFAVNAGSIAFVPKDTWHGLQNNGNGILEFVFGYQPGGFEDFFRKIGTPAGQLFVAKSKPEIVRWAAQYGMVYK